MNDYLTRVDPEILEPWKSKEATLWKRTDSKLVRESQRFVVRVPLLYLREKTDARIVTTIPVAGSEFWVDRLRAHLQKLPVARDVSRGLTLDYAVKAATNRTLNELGLPLSVHEASDNLLEVRAPAREWSRSREELLTRLRSAGDPVQFVTNYEPSTILSFIGKTGSDLRKTYWGTVRRVNIQKQYVVIQLLSHLPIYRTFRFDRILEIGDLPIFNRGDLTAVRLRDIFIEFDSRKRVRVYRESLRGELQAENDFEGPSSVSWEGNYPPRPPLAEVYGKHKKLAAETARLRMKLDYLIEKGQKATNDR